MLSSAWLMRLLPLSLAVSLLASGCTPELIPPPQEGVLRGWVPVYVAEAEAREVVRIPSVPSESRRLATSLRRARRVASGEVTVALDSLVGIAVYRGAADDLSLLELGSYLRIPGANQLSGRVDSLVVNNLDDLLVLDASDPTRVVGRGRVDGGAGAYDFPADRPSGTAVAEDGRRVTPRYFVCPDTARGRLLGWRYERADALDCILTP